MDALRQARINLKCLEFVHQNLSGDELIKWSQFRNSYTKLDLDQVIDLTRTINDYVIDLTYVPSDLILNGFGCETINVAQLDALMKEENEGCALQKVAVAA